MEALIVVAGCIVALCLCIVGDYLDAKRAAYWLSIRRRIGLI